MKRTLISVALAFLMGCGSPVTPAPKAEPKSPAAVEPPSKEEADADADAAASRMAGAFKKWFGGRKKESPTPDKSASPASEPKEAARPEGMAVFSTEELVRRYKKNQVELEAAMTGKRVRVSGIIAEIWSHEGKPVVTVTSVWPHVDGYRIRVHFAFTAKETKSVARLAKRQQVVLEGDFKGIRSLPTSTFRGDIAFTFDQAKIITTGKVLPEEDLTSMLLGAAGMDKRDTPPEGDSGDLSTRSRGHHINTRPVNVLLPKDLTVAPGGKLSIPVKLKRLVYRRRTGVTGSGRAGAITELYESEVHVSFRLPDLWCGPGVDSSDEVVLRKTIPKGKNDATFEITIPATCPRGKFILRFYHATTWGMPVMPDEMTVLVR